MWKREMHTAAMKGIKGMMKLRSIA